MRLLGVQIAKAYGDDALVFANLLAGRRNAYNALVLHHDWPGGREHTARFERDAQVTLARFDTGWRPNLENRRLLIGKLRSRLQFAYTIPKLRVAAGRYAPDVIYSSQQSWDCRVATDVARHLRKPQIVHLHTQMGPWLGASVLQTLRECAHLVVGSEAHRTAALREGVAPGRITVIHAPMTFPPPPGPAERASARARLDLPQDAVVVGMIAPLDRLKGQEDTLRAFARVAASSANTFLVLAGDPKKARSGLSRAVLERQAADAGLSSRLRWAAAPTEPQSVLAALDIFMRPAHDDVLGLALAQASAARLPVLAYARGAMPEVVLDRHSGFLSAPGDIDALAANLSQLLGDSSLRQRLGEAGRSHCLRLFCPDTAARNFATLLRTVAA